MKHVLITGGTGLIGTALSAELVRAGHEVTVLTRNPANARRLPEKVKAEQWDGRTAEGWGHLVNGASAVVNLAGASIGIPPIPWTADRKRRIRASRIDAGHAVVAAVCAASDKPGVVIQSSAIGYYGLHGDEIVTEAAPSGQDYLSSVTVDWEVSTAEVETVGVRRAIVRTGLPVSRAGGVLPWLSLPFRFFVGGPLGSGRQWISWIHIADEVGAIRFLIEQESARGAYNLTAPNPLTNRDFARVLGRVMKRPALIPVPGVAMKLALGEMAELLLLGGQRVLPARLSEAGYGFQFPDAQSALQDLLAARQPGAKRDA
jgi:uncharacterized protein (TIGR01777 family)